MMFDVLRYLIWEVMEDKEQQNIDDVEKLEAFANSKSKVYAFPPATNSYNFV